MDLVRGQKVKVSNANIEVEIMGILPSSQPFQVNWSGSTIYNVKINGEQVYIKESVLHRIINAGQSGTIEKATEIKEQQNEPTNIEPKKRGRPKLS